MALQEQRADNAFRTHIAEVRAVWGDGKDPQLPYKVAGLMEKLFAARPALTIPALSVTANPRASFIATPLTASSNGPCA